LLAGSDRINKEITPTPAASGSADDQRKMDTETKDNEQGMGVASGGFTRCISPVWAHEDANSILPEKAEASIKEIAKGLKPVSLF